MKVTIIRSQNHYRRSCNGAWMSAGFTVDQPIAVEEVKAKGYLLGMGLSGSARVDWPDGHREYWHHNSSLQLEGPGDSRLRKPEHRNKRSLWWPAVDQEQWIEQEAA